MKTMKTTTRKVAKKSMTKAQKGKEVGMYSPETSTKKKPDRNLESTSDYKTVRSKTSGQSTKKTMERTFTNSMGKTQKDKKVEKQKGEFGDEKTKNKTKFVYNVEGPGGREVYKYTQKYSPKKGLTQKRKTNR
jgi:hypothetical protein